MKILVFSDSHGDTGRMYYTVLEEKPDAVIHLGDTVADAEALSRMFPTLALCYVAGNNDYFCTAPMQTFYSAAGIKMFVCHGHRYGVKNDVSMLAASAAKNGCNIALFGHTHSPYDETVNGVRLLNPGSVTFGGSYLRITAQNGDVKAELLEI